MGAHGSKNHRSPIRSHHRKHYHLDSVDGSPGFDPTPSQLMAQPHSRHQQQFGGHQHHQQQQHQQLAPTGYHRKGPAPRPRPQLNYAGSELSSGQGAISVNPFPNRTLRPILAPQSSQYDGPATMQRRTGGGSRFSTNYRQGSVDRAPSSGASGTLPKQVQFSNLQPQNRVTFGSTSAITSRGEAADFPFAEASAIFTRAKDSHRASQLSINVAPRPENPPPMQGSLTIDRRFSSSQRAPTRTSTLRRSLHGGHVGGTMTRYKSDPALVDENVAGSLPRVEVDIDRFDDMDGGDFASSHLRQVRNPAGSDLGDGPRPKLRVMRQPPGPASMMSGRSMNRAGPPAGSVTELSDIVAANSADSGVEMKPELFSLLSDNSPRMEPPLPSNRHHSLPRNRHYQPQPPPPQQQQQSQRSQPVNNLPQYSSSSASSHRCNCDECQQQQQQEPAVVVRRFSTLDSRQQQQQQQQRGRSGNPRLSRPLPPEPPANSSEDPDYNNANNYEDSECPYEGCCCGAANSAVNGNTSIAESDYQRLVHRSYKGQPPILRRGTVLPPKQPSSSTMSRREQTSSEDIYTAAFSGESTLLRKASSKPAKSRAPDPPQRRRPSSMFTISPAGTDEKENEQQQLEQDSTTFLAKEKNGALVIVNRPDLEAGLLSGKYVQYDIAPALLLDQANQRQLQQQSTSAEQQDQEQHEQVSVGLATTASLLMTVDDSASSAAQLLMMSEAMNYDSGVSPSATDQSSVSASNNSNNTNSNVNSNASDSSGSPPPPPLLPPRQRGSSVASTGLTTSSNRRNSSSSVVSSSRISSSNINESSSAIRRRTDSDAGHHHHNSHHQQQVMLVDATLRELSIVSPPTPGSHHLDLEPSSLSSAHSQLQALE